MSLEKNLFISCCLHRGESKNANLAEDLLSTLSLHKHLDVFQGVCQNPGNPVKIRKMGKCQRNPLSINQGN